MTWQLQDAKNKLSEVIDRARKHGPQKVTRRGREVAVIVSIEDFQRLRREEKDIVAFFGESPLAEAEVRTDRNTGPFRRVTL